MQQPHDGSNQGGLYEKRIVLSPLQASTVSKKRRARTFPRDLEAGVRSTREPRIDQMRLAGNVATRNLLTLS